MNPEPLPAAVGIADQWQAEVMDTARDLTATKFAELGIQLEQDQMDILEGGMAVGYAATLVVMAANGWLRKP